MALSSFSSVNFIGASITHEHVHDQSNQRFLLFRVGLCNQQRHGREPSVVDLRLAPRIDQAAIAMQEIDEQEGTATLVAVRERMILDDEIQQVRCLALDGGIGRLSEYTLLQVAEDAVQAIAAWPGKEIGGLPTRHQLLLEFAKGLQAISAVGRLPPE